MKRVIHVFFVSVVLIMCCNKLHSQRKINKDSLMNVLQTMKDDTGKVKLLRDLCFDLHLSDPQKAIEYGEKGISLSEKINFQKGKSECLHEIGVVHYYQGKYDKSLERYLSALKILEEKTDTTNADTRKLIADNLHDIGKVYYRQHQFEKALSSYEQALLIYKQLNHKWGISTCLNNIGGVYDARENFEKTLYYLKESLKITEEIGDKSGIATRVNNIGLQYMAQKKYNEALRYLTRAMKIREEIADTKGLAYSYNDVGDLYVELKNYDKALNFLNKGLELAQKSNAKERIKASYETLSKTYSYLKEFDKAYEYHLLLSELKDSLFNEESSRQIAEMSAKYESDKKQHQIELLQKDKELQASELAKSDAERKKQLIQKSAFALGFILVFVLSLVIFRGYRLKHKANTMLTEKNIIIEKQKKIVEEKNKDITDSIHYAENIQQATLPRIEDIRKVLPDSFVLFKPKDIVSGDFYFFANIHTHRPPLDRGGVPSRGFPPLKRGGQGVCNENGLIILAACDSTGHGVPGAFMSMLGSQLLNEIVNDKSVTDAAEVLNQLKKGIIHAFGKAGARGEQKDGMDMALCVFNLKTNKLQYAGANNPLYIIHPVIPIPIHRERNPLDNLTASVGESTSPQNELTEIKPDLSVETSNHNYKLYEVKADKQPVGYTAGEQTPFTNHDIQLDKGDTIYMSSDGYQDQFGGEAGKKFMRKQFKHLLLEIHGMGMEEQKEHLNKTIEEWKGSGEQVDDILVIGVKV